MSEALETHERAKHAAEEGRSYTALLIAVLAACLAFSEQGAKHAETRQGEAALRAADLWSEYQAKSIRAATAGNFADLVESMEVTDPAAAAKQATLAARLRSDRQHYESDAGSGKKALAEHAHEEEGLRDHALLRLHGFENASAAFQLAIVLATASVIVGSGMLVIGALGIGAAGAVLAVLAMTSPVLAGF